MSQRLLQQSPSLEQLPLDLHAHLPSEPQVPLQHWSSPKQVAPVTPQAQVPVAVSQLPSQQSAAVTQVPPGELQAHWPPSLQKLVQHCPSAVQVPPAAVQAQLRANGFWLVSHTPEQQSPPPLQVLPAAPQQLLLTQS